MRFKKAQVGGLQGFILSIVTVAIVLAIGLIVLGELKETARDLEDRTSVINETVSVTMGAIGSVSQGSYCTGITGIHNASGTDGVPDLFDDCNVTVSSAGCSFFCNFTDSANFTYTHYTLSKAYNSTTSIVTKLATVPTWLGIVIIVSLAFIVLSFFIGRRQ